MVARNLASNRARSQGDKTPWTYHRQIAAGPDVQACHELVYVFFKVPESLARCKKYSISTTNGQNDHIRIPIRFPAPIIPPI